MSLSPDFDARSEMQRAISCLRDAATELELILARREYDFAFVSDTRLPMARERCEAATSHILRAGFAAKDLFRPTFDFLPNAEGAAIAEVRAAA